MPEQSNPSVSPTRFVKGAGSGTLQSGQPVLVRDSKRGETRKGRLFVVTLVGETCYAKSGDVSVAYQVVGAGTRDLVFVPGII